MDGTDMGDRAGGPVQLLARMGYAAKGVVYMAVGLLSARAALGGGDAASSREAISRIASGGLGTAILAVLAAGLTGYVAWRLIQAFADPENRGSDARALLTRFVLFLSAAAYASLGLWVVRALLDDGSGASGGGSAAESWSARLLAQPFGAWLLGAAGIAVAGFGVSEWVKAVRADFEKRMRHDLSGDVRRWARRIARAGLAARGLVFLLVGGFLVWAAVQSDPSRARGLEGALGMLASQPFGPWIMAAVAAGLAAYGAFQWVKAWYRRV